MTINSFLCLQITKSDISSEVKWSVSLVIAYGHLNLSQRFVWVWVGRHMQFMTFEGGQQWASGCQYFVLLSLCFHCKVLHKYVHFLFVHANFRFTFWFIIICTIRMTGNVLHEKYFVSIRDTNMHHQYHQYGHHHSSYLCCNEYSLCLSWVGVEFTCQQCPVKVRTCSIMDITPSPSSPVIRSNAKL